MSILEAINDPSNTTLQIFLLLIAGLRIYLEIIKFKFDALPLSKGLFKSNEQIERFHRVGLYLSVGFILTIAPGFLLA